MMYTDISASREVRQVKLRRLYGFRCECTYCDLQDDRAVTHSDLSRARLRDWRHTNPGYLKWSIDLCRADDVVIKGHQEALELIEQEGMFGLQCLYMEEIMLCYAVLGDEALFRNWAQKLLNLCTIQDPDLAADLRQWLENPRSMKKWSWRKKQRIRERASGSPPCIRGTDRGLEMEVGRRRKIPGGPPPPSPELLFSTLFNPTEG